MKRIKKGVNVQKAGEWRVVGDTLSGERRLVCLGGCEVRKNNKAISRKLSQQVRVLDGG